MYVRICILKALPTSLYNPAVKVRVEWQIKCNVLSGDELFFYETLSRSIFCANEVDIYVFYFTDFMT